MCVCVGGSDQKDLVLTAALPLLRCDCTQRQEASLGLLSHLASRSRAPPKFPLRDAVKTDEIQVHFRVFISWIRPNPL